MSTTCPATNVKGSCTHLLSSVLVGEGTGPPSSVFVGGLLSATLFGVGAGSLSATLFGKGASGPSSIISEELMRTGDALFFIRRWISSCIAPVSFFAAHITKSIGCLNYNV